VDPTNSADIISSMRDQFGDSLNDAQLIQASRLAPRLAERGIDPAVAAGVLYEAVLGLPAMGDTLGSVEESSRGWLRGRDKERERAQGLYPLHQMDQGLHAMENLNGILQGHPGIPYGMRDPLH
jgi:hypothetical protein